MQQLNCAARTMCCALMCHVAERKDSIHGVFDNNYHFTELLRYLINNKAWFSCNQVIIWTFLIFVDKAIYNKRKHTISGVRVSPGSAETLVRGGGKLKHGLVAYSLSYTYAKNYQNQLLDVRITVYQLSHFLTQCSYAPILILISKFRN